MDTTTLLTVLSTLTVGLVLGGLIGWLGARTRLPQDEARALESRAAAQAADRAADQAVVKDGLDRLADQVRQLEHNRVAWQGELNAQFEHMRLSTESLRRETSSLSTALRKPQVRGRWGEMHLRRAVELAGLVDRCDFSEQHRMDDGRLRPDLVVHLAGGRHVVVDAKVPLDAFLDATSTDDEEEQLHHLGRHARQLRAHVRALSDKAYWRAMPETPDFVVMFVPAEAFLSAALEAEPSLLEFAAERSVVIATPTTLIALLRTVAHGWSHETLASQVAEVQRLGRELHERLSTMGDHLSRVGRSLTGAVQAYNQAVGSIEGRVLVTARRFESLGVVETTLPEVAQVEATARSLAAPELTLLDETDPLAGDLARLSTSPRPEDAEGTARRAEGA